MMNACEQTAAQDQAAATDKVTTSHHEQHGWQISSAQMVGLNHTACEDTALSRIDDQTMGLAMCDGVGGGSHGEVTSRLCATHALAMPLKLWKDQVDITCWMNLSEAVVQHGLRQVSFLDGATTLSAVWLSLDGEGFFLNVGDSRIYKITTAAMLALSIDDNYANLGEPVPEGGKPDDPARQIGAGAMGALKVQALTLTPDEALLLSTDGLHGTLSSIEIHDIVLRYDSQEEACRQLVLSALQKGSTDDISVMIARRKKDPIEASFWQKMSTLF